MDASSKKSKRRDAKTTSIYSRSLITRNVSIPITFIGKNIQNTINKTVSSTFEGKCIVEGFVKPASIKVLTFSSGLVRAGHIVFEVVFECQVCSPVEGMQIVCVAKNITKAGIRAESADQHPSPVMVFVTRDHNYTSGYFSTIKEDDRFTARVIGQRFELNDPYVSIIADIVEPKAVAKKKIIIDADEES
jgi:DNA-directed RNA polymerase subunit E'/Rpb7